MIIFEEIVFHSVIQNDKKIDGEKFQETPQNPSHPGALCGSLCGSLYNTDCLKNPSSQNFRRPPKIPPTQVHSVVHSVVHSIIQTDQKSLTLYHSLPEKTLQNIF
jgi:hypothetical protein